jgi:hypothetical protein
MIERNESLALTRARIFYTKMYNVLMKARILFGMRIRQTTKHGKYGSREAADYLCSGGFIQMLQHLWTRSMKNVIYIVSLVYRIQDTNGREFNYTLSKMID